MSKRPEREPKYSSQLIVEMKNLRVSSFPMPCASVTWCFVQPWDKCAFTLWNIIRVIKLVECGLWKWWASEMLTEFWSEDLKGKVPLGEHEVEGKITSKCEKLISQSSILLFMKRRFYGFSRAKQGQTLRRTVVISNSDLTNPRRIAIFG